MEIRVFFRISLADREKTSNCVGKFAISKTDTIYNVTLKIEHRKKWKCDEGALVELKFEDNSVINIKTKSKSESKHNSTGAGDFYENYGDIIIELDNNSLLNLKSKKLTKIRVTLEEGFAICDVKSDNVLKYCKCIQ